MHEYGQTSVVHDSKFRELIFMEYETPLNAVLDTNELSVNDVELEIELIVLSGASVGAEVDLTTNNAPSIEVFHPVETPVTVVALEATLIVPAL